MSYWCTEFLIVTVDGPGGQTVLPLDQPFARVGRHPQADVCLPDRAVPSRALYLHATRAGVFCLFLDRDDSGPDRTGIWLSPEQSVEVGPYRIRASLLTAEPEDALPSELPSAWGSAKPPLPVMMIYCGNRLKDKRRFRSILSPVGRRPQCALQLKGQKVSGFHCVLFWDQQRLWCIDLNSSNGTQRNGQEIVCAEVVLGDRLEVGDFHLVFQRLSSGGRTGSSEPAELADEGLANPSTLHGEQLGSASEDSPPASAGWGTQVVPVRSIARWKTDINEDSQLELDDRTRSHAAVGADSSVPSILDTAAADSSVDTSSQAIAEAERRQLREELAAEVAKLARQREEMQAEWQSATARLQKQTEQLEAKLQAVEGEAARLERQRAELQTAQHAWQAEQAASAMRMAERGEQLTSLEAELAARTAQIEAQLALVQQQAAAAELAARERRAAERAAAEQAAAERKAAEAAAAEAAAAQSREALRAAEEAQRDAVFSHASLDTAEPIDWPLDESMAPQTLVEGLAADADPMLVEQVSAHVEWAFDPAIADRLAAPLDQASPEVQSPSAEQSPPPWSQATDRLAAEIEQLRQHSQSLAAEKQSLEEARADWQHERQAILDQLAGRSAELSRLESELHQSQQTFEQRIDARLQEKWAQAAPQLAATPEPHPPQASAGSVPQAAAQSAEELVVDSDEPDSGLSIEAQEPDLAVTASIDDSEPVLDSSLAEPLAELLAEPSALALPTAPLSVPPSSSSDPVETAAGISTIRIEEFRRAASPVAVNAEEQPLAHPIGPFVPDPHAASPEEQKMREFLNSRLVQLDHERSGRPWLWWAIGGAGVTLLATFAFAVYKWMM
jgi:hypothetical protein